MLSQDGKQVRSVDIASALGFSRPTISVAVKNLQAAGYLQVGEGGYIGLTATGQAIAQRMYDRHTLISDWLIFLGVERETAVKDACKIEHDISEESFIALQKHISSNREFL